MIGNRCDTYSQPSPQRCVGKQALHPRALPLPTRRLHLFFNTLEISDMYKFRHLLVVADFATLIAAYGVNPTDREKDGFQVWGGPRPPPAPRRDAPGLRARRNHGPQGTATVKHNDKKNQGRLPKYEPPFGAPTMLPVVLF